MTTDEAGAVEQPNDPCLKKSWASRHPKFMILLIAGVFYVMLISMCLFVLVLVLRG